jgi:CHAT domain-containing protein
MAKLSCGFLVAIAFLSLARPVIAAAPDPVAEEAGAAIRLFGEGKAQTARQRLEALLDGPEVRSPGARTAVLRTLLDICLHGGDADCVTRHAPEFAAVAEHAPVANQVQRAQLALEAVYYLDEARRVSGMAPALILAEPLWKTQVAYDGDLYLRRQVLASNLLLASGRSGELDRSIDKILSLIAALKTPQASRLTVASSLADVMATLVEIGETQRAWGLFRAAGAEISQAMPQLSLDQALYALNTAKLLVQMGDVGGARKLLDSAVQLLDRVEVAADTRTRLLAEARTLQIVLAETAGDRDGMIAALQAHPFTPLYREAGRAPASPEEVAYLAARGLATAVLQVSDPVTVQALKAPREFKADAETLAVTAAGEALALPPGPQRVASLQDLVRRMRDYAVDEDKAGRLTRLSAIDRILLSLALTQADAAKTAGDRDAVFILFQLAPRNGASFDADALAALGQAQDELQRRAVHQALRLAARRDRLEREQIQRVAVAMAGPASSGVLQHDAGARLRLRDYDEGVAAARDELARHGLSIRGRRLVSLAQLQAVLAPDEAALAVAPTIGGVAYLCVRRDRTEQAVAAVDIRQLPLDAKLLQAALTANYAPSEELDAQFPVAAAVRLYGAIVKPFETCLNPKDRILWLSDVGYAGAPLAVLLPTAPPKAGAGYDLAAADWLVRRHAVSYAGSAAALVSLRAPGARPQADLDFLGVGDPKLDGLTPGGEDRTRIATRGVRAGGRFDGLSALPETRAELQASAQGFRSPRLLLGEAATEQAVRGDVVGEYRYLSFATHGLLRDDLQGLADPALVLTPQSAADSADDGLLTASEIADLNLHAAFVALSACNTANFDFDQIAQDLPALASAFAISGVPATLGTLWPVDSRTGEAVVSAVFAKLRQGEPPGAALAQAQRDFLAAPPGRAYLHPRFWAPFVVMGDGGAPPPAPDRGPLALRKVELLTAGGGEVVALAPAAGGVAARFIADKDAGGRHGQGLRLADAAGTELWRAVDHDGGATVPLGMLDSQLLVGGYAVSGRGRNAPTLELRTRDGAQSRRWIGEALSPVDAFVFAGVIKDPATAFVAVGELNLRDPPAAGGGRIHILQVGPQLEPRVLFEITAPPKTTLSDVALLVLGDRLLVSYADSTPTFAPGLGGGLDDYVPDGCERDRITWLELRDLKTGAVVAQQTIPGVAVTRAAAGGHGEILLAGSRREHCLGDAKAVVLALDDKLAPRTVYVDDSLGASYARVLAPLPRGRVLVAAIKADEMDAVAAPAAPGRLHATLAVVLDEAGRASRPKLLDAGSDLLPSAAMTAGDEVLLGGSVGGQAAIFHLAAPP